MKSSTDFSFLYDFFRDMVWPAVAAFLTYVWTKRVHAKKQFKPAVPIAESHKKDRQLWTLLTELRVLTGAARAYISQYHNGDHYVDGNDIIRKSRTHEVVEPGVTFQSEDYKAVLVSTLPDETALVIDEGCSYTLVDDLPQGRFRWLCEQGGAVAVIRYALKKQGKVIGFLGLDFHDRRQRETDRIEEYGRHINQLLLFDQGQE